MKIILTIILLLPLSVWGMSPVMCGGGETFVCTTVTGDEFVEYFEGGASVCSTNGSETTCNVTWAGSGTSASRVLASCPSGQPSTACLTCFRANVANDSASIYWTRGSDIDVSVVDFTITFTMYVNAISLTDTTTAMIFNFNKNTGTPSAVGAIACTIKNNGGTYQLGCGNTPNYVNISTQTWYTVVMHSIDTTANTGYFTINGGEQNQMSTNNVDSLTVHLGAITGVGAGESLDIYFGNIYMSTP